MSGTARGTASAPLPQKVAPVSGTAPLPPIERERCRAGTASLWEVGERCRSPRAGQTVEPSSAPFAKTVEALERRCPDHVPADRWHQAVEDGRRFLARWGDQAVALGWTERDLFGLHEPPEKPHPSYRRLSRYDQTWLIWLLQGRPVVALTEATAAIQSSTGAITIYRRHSKPALGPVGDRHDKGLGMYGFLEWWRAQPRSQRRPGWDVWGIETDKFTADKQTSEQ
jgi:hypothetical protein